MRTRNRKQLRIRIFPSIEMRGDKKVRGTENKNWLGKTWAPDGNWNKFPTYD